MSVAAMGWAFRQRLPAKPKIVLLALADQADERTGRVCYGKTDAKYLAEKSTVSERSLYRYLAALIRNGYAVRESGKDKGHASQFWLCLDRPPSELTEWQWNIILPDDDGEPAEADTDTQDIEGSATMADPQNAPDNAEIGRPPPPIRGRARVSESRRDIRPDSWNEQESSFSKSAQDLEREAGAIRKKAETEDARQFVIEDSRAWYFWVAYRRKMGIRPARMATCNGVGEFAGKRGWYMPSLFPPSAHDPPAELSDEDARELAKL